jgi:hypothetical protein
VNIAEEVAQLQEKSFWIFDFGSEVVVGKGDAIFGNRKILIEKCFLEEGNHENPKG